MGVPLQLCLPGISQASAGFLWPHGLVMHTMVRGHTFQIDPRLISSMIGVPVLPVPGVPFPPAVEAPSIDFLHDFFGTRPQREDKSHSQINIGAFTPMHRFLEKVVVTNLWPQACRSELTLKKATLLYAIVMRTPFCLCKHILHTMLEVRDETNTSLSFGCLITQICLHKRHLNTNANQTLRQRD
jgi:hypothetical protein